MKNYCLLVLSVFLSVEHAFPQDRECVPGNSYWGSGQFIEYRAGNLPIVISVPHGGSMKPDCIPDRAFGVDFKDAGTQEIARLMIERFREKTGKYPFVVFNNLHRKKLDANREEFEATADDPVAGIAWNEYQAFIDSAAHRIRATAGKGLFIDLHGHNHPIEQIELGYRLEQSDLAMTDSCLNAKEVVERSSLKNLMTASPMSHAEIVRGRTSFGALFDARSIPSTPSPSVPVPQSVQFFSGGYNTYRHTVENDSTLFGVQFELNEKLRKASEHEHTAALLVDVILEFLEKHPCAITAK